MQVVRVVCVEVKKTRYVGCVETCIKLPPKSPGSTLYPGWRHFKVALPAQERVGPESAHEGLLESFTEVSVVMYGMPEGH